MISLLIDSQTLIKTGIKYFITIESREFMKKT